VENVYGSRKHVQNPKDTDISVKSLGGQNILAAHPVSQLGGQLPTLPRFPPPVTAASVTAGTGVLRHCERMTFDNQSNGRRIEVDSQL